MNKSVFNNSVKNYLSELSGVKRLSENTLVAYEKDLSQFIDFLAKKNIFCYKDVLERNVRLFIVELNDQELSRTSISRKLSVLRGYFKFLQQNNLIQENPLTEIHNPKVNRKLPEIITIDSYEKIIKLIGEESNNNADLKLIFELLYGSALRVSEVCNLNYGDIDLSRKNIRVLGKGNKTRIVPIGEKALLIYREYLQSRTFSSPSDPLILTKSKKRIYPKYVYRLVNKYLSKKSDVAKKSPHVLRHSAATHMLDKGADLMGVKEILGHENLSTTQIYTHVSIERLKKAHKNAHPKS